MKVQSQLNLTNADTAPSFSHKIGNHHSTANLDMAKINLNSKSEDHMATLTSSSPKVGEDRTASANVNFLDNPDESTVDITTSKVQLNIIDESKSETKSHKSIAAASNNGVTPVKLVSTLDPKQKSPIEIHKHATLVFKDNGEKLKNMKNKITKRVKVDRVKGFSEEKPSPPKK